MIDYHIPINHMIFNSQFVPQAYILFANYKFFFVIFCDRIVYVSGHYTKRMRPKIGMAYSKKRRKLQQCNNEQQCYYPSFTIPMYIFY